MPTPNGAPAARKRRRKAPWRDRQGRFSALKAATLALCLAPGATVAFWLLAGTLGGRPIKAALLWIGLWTVRFIMIALAVTPLATVLNWPRLLLLRRMAGVTAGAYALAHLTLYAVDQNLRLGLVAGEILHRFYLTIGFVALLGLAALTVTSTDAAVRRMGKGWGRLHRLAYPIGALALLHYFIQSKANVSEPVFLAGLYAWLMLWRLTPKAWRGSVVLYPALALATAGAAAGIEFAWYALATGIDPWRVLAANETLRFGLRPAHWAGLAALALLLPALARRPRRRRDPGGFPRGLTPAEGE